MSRTSDNEPLAPRRSLRKAQSLDEPTTQMAPTAAAPSATAPSAAMPAMAAPPVTGEPSRRTAAPVIDKAPPAPPGASAPMQQQQRSQRPQPAATEERPAAVPPNRASAARSTGVRRARLRLVRVDPWSVAKTAFLLSIAFGIMVVVAVFLIMSVMSAAGLWAHVNSSIQTILNQGGSTGSFNINDYVSTQRVVGVAILIAALDVLLMTALATLGAFLYNLAASLLGGLEVTLAEDLKR